VRASIDLRPLPLAARCLLLAACSIPREEVSAEKLRRAENPTKIVAGAWSDLGPHLIECELYF
jgi:hypothetical protein